MNSDTEIPACNAAADAAPQKKPALLRIKRRRGEAATDEIIVATAQPRADPKRLRMDQMLLQMTGFGISQTMAPAAPEPQKRQRFRRVKTVDLVAFNDKTAVEMELMVATWSTDARSAGGAAPSTAPGPASAPGATGDVSTELQGAEGAMPLGIVPPGEEAASASLPGAGSASPLHRTPPKTAAQGPSSVRHMKEALRDMAMQRSSTARYMQVRAKRQQQQEQQQQQQGAESAFQILDLVCTDVDEAGSAERAERKRQAQEQSKKAAADGVILMNYMPMVHQFLEEHGLPVPPESKEQELESAATAAAGAGEKRSCSCAGAGAAGGEDVVMSAGAEDDPEQEFVYDVYVPVTEADGGTWPGEPDPEGVPVVEVEDLEDPFYEYADSLHDSEDSNAESYYANSYPDEDEAGYDEDEDEEGWCHVAQRGGEGAQRTAAAWDDEEYDLTKDADPDCTFVPHVPDDPDAGPAAGAGAARADMLFFLKASRAQAAAQKQGRARQQGEWGVRIR